MSNTSFNVGEVIWAKIRGYPWWPAMITGTEDDNREKKYAVSFIGDNTHSSLAKKCLEKFEKGLKMYSNTKKKNLLDTIEKAKEIYYNKNGIKDKEIKYMMKRDRDMKIKEKEREKEKQQNNNINNNNKEKNNETNAKNYLIEEDLEVKLNEKLIKKSYLLGNINDLKLQIKFIEDKQKEEKLREEKKAQAAKLIGSNKKRINKNKHTKNMFNNIFKKSLSYTNIFSKNN